MEQQMPLSWCPYCGAQLHHVGHLIINPANKVWQCRACSADEEDTHYYDDVGLGVGKSEFNAIKEPER